MPPPLMQKAVAPKLFTSCTSARASIFGSSPSRRLTSSTRFGRSHQFVTAAIGAHAPAKRLRISLQAHRIAPRAFEEMRLQRFARASLELLLLRLLVQHLGRGLVAHG